MLPDLADNKGFIDKKRALKARFDMENIAEIADLVKYPSSSAVFLNFSHEPPFFAD